MLRISSKYRDVELNALITSACITGLWLAHGIVNSMKLSSCAHIKNDMLTQRGTVWGAFR